MVYCQHHKGTASTAYCRDTWPTALERFPVARRRGDLPMHTPDTLDRSDAFCIVGGGSSGITAAKNLKALGIPFDVYEREDGIGGNWYYGKPNSSVYRSIHLIS